MTLHDDALEAGAWQYIESRAKELKDAARQRIKTALPFGDTVAGRTDDQIVCKASWVKGRQKITVTNDTELLAWVKEHRPTELVESVNPAYIKSFKAVGGVVIDSQGEPVPGVEVIEGEPYVTVRASDDAPFLVATLFRRGQVTLDGITPKAIDAPVIDAEVVE